MPAKKSDKSARERLLEAANELFYAEGVHTVGIDRVIERAGVAKASLYSTFGSKEELVRAYLQERADRRRRRMTSYMDRYDTPRGKILAIFEAQAEGCATPGYRGCAFINASAEGPRGAAPRVCDDTRAWFRDLLTDLARELGAKAPEQLADQLAMVYDGVAVAASMDEATQAPARARAMVELLLDSAV